MALPKNTTTIEEFIEAGKGTKLAYFDLSFADKLSNGNWISVLNVVNDYMDELRNGIGLRAYGQQDPVVKYRMEGMDMFEERIANIKADVVKILMNIRKQNGEVKRQEAVKITGAALEAINSVDGGKKINTPEYSQTVVNEGPKVGRNDPCPCGSGKKYKNCCGK